MSSKGDPELPPIVDALWQIAGITNDDDLFSDTEVSTPKGASVSVPVSYTHLTLPTIYSV